ncbi:hypothetical protein A3L09_10400 [Thermococcus profundus]|uniref:Uncharacterized protein n=1 Tax=Thermococcus profundus TaxID=49899 RepID=A0A2Z2MP11_THEPR|nr:hypothetical protein [Thermococcus profundus]ASJ03638.1 hypothetical protein A3L09_10400 [Thermococcus profundus]
MVLEPLRLAFKYALIKVGFLLLVLALVLSLASMYGIEKNYHESGHLGPGLHVIGDDHFERAYYTYKRVLLLNSTNASVSVNNVTYSVTGLVNVTPSLRPSVEVLSGNVSYDYTVRATDYPLAYLSLLAFLFFIVGLVLAVQGYIRMIGDIRSSRKR